MKFQLYRTSSLFIFALFVLSVIVTWLIPLTSRAQVKSQSETSVEWAFKVINFSSEYSKKEKSANQILGKPNVLPYGGSSPCAWTVKKKSIINNPKKAFIRVAFEKPIKATQVAIAENYCPGAIEKIILYGNNNQETVVYQSTPNPVNAGSGMLNVFFEAPPFDIIEGELVLRPDKIPDFEIDAFGISDNNDTIKAVINTIPNMKYFSNRESLGNNINTKLDEVSPVISPDGKSMYFDRKFAEENMGGQADEDDIWYSQLNANGKWDIAVNVGPPLNTKGNNFVQSISPDGNTLLLGNVYNKTGTMYQGVSISNKTRNGWSIPVTQEIEDFNNLNQYVNYYLTNDNKFLLIAMETDSSYGGLDLYVSTKTGENNWSKPKNLDPIINTAANDFSPFLAADGITLYYSTSGISGYGKDDIFITRRLDNSWQNWTEPMNLGSEINTKEVDSKYTIPASGEFAYFSSSANSMGLHDIFRIRLPEIVKPKPVVLIKGTVWDEKNNKAIPAEIIYETLPEGKEVGRARSDPNTGEYTIVLPIGYNYSFRAIADDFIGVSQNINLKEVTEYSEIKQDNLKLTPIEIGAVVTLNNIFFDYANAELKSESFSELNRVVEFMKENPKVEIEIGGHTDNISSDATNDKLSKSRAVAVMNYIISKGIPASHITAVGYGKSKPIDTNETEKGRAKNRRVEFTITKR